MSGRRDGVSLQGAKRPTSEKAFQSRSTPRRVSKEMILRITKAEARYIETVFKIVSDCAAFDPCEIKKCVLSVEAKVRKLLHRV